MKWDICKQIVTKKQPVCRLFNQEFQRQQCHMAPNIMI